MSLSEFISKNENAQLPDARVEWEQGKLMIDTLIASGAVDLLVRLKDSIESNPLLSKSNFGSVILGEAYYWVESRGVTEYKNLNVRDNQRGRIFLIAKTDPDVDIDGSSYYYRGFHIYGGADNTYARMGIEYNPHDVVLTDRDRSVIHEQHFGVFQQYPLRYKQLIYDYLSIECSEPGVLLLASGDTQLGGIARRLLEAEWRQSGVVDKVLGELYASRPAKLKG